VAGTPVIRSTALLENSRAVLSARLQRALQ
jgi:hypothetical protein